MKKQYQSMPRGEAKETLEFARQRLTLLSELIYNLPGRRQIYDLVRENCKALVTDINFALDEVEEQLR